MSDKQTQIASSDDVPAVFPHNFDLDAKKFYITTTLPYVNAKPHLGFAWEIVTADFLARYHRWQGEVTYFNTGTDEHGQKIYQKATELGISPQAYVDQMVGEYFALKSSLELSHTHFIRTTDERHVSAAQEFWRRCQANGDIYKKKYVTKYCVGCELEKTDSELDHGHCPLHPHLELEQREEDNYFFRFSRYQQPLLDYYQAHPDFVLGQGKMSELESFVRRGLQDFSISRLKEKMPWGISVPGDDSQVMYVWFDALVNYISTLGWPYEDSDCDYFWPGVQICGKDNLRQQGAMWPAMLMSAGLSPAKHVLVNGFITVDGQKMSKSLGNVISPGDLVSQYGTENTRFILAGFPDLVGDVDVTKKRIHDFYSAYLTNGLGNLASRLAKLASSIESGWDLPVEEKFTPEFAAAMEAYNPNAALQTILDRLSGFDKRLSAAHPWSLTDAEEKKQALLPILIDFLAMAYDLRVFMPHTSQTILGHFHPRRIMPLPPLFPRIKINQKVSDVQDL